MDKAAVMQHIKELGLVPVVRANSAEQAMQAIDAIKAGGIDILEITMTVPGAVSVIAECARKYGREVVNAWEGGADFVKVFPCSALGGASYIKALKAPMPQIELLPTGGVNLKTAGEFIAAGSSALGVGADLVDLKAIAAGETASVTDKAKQLVQIVKDARTG